jgi:hypothetical protein
MPDGGGGGAKATHHPEKCSTSHGLRLLSKTQVNTMKVASEADNLHHTN